MKHIKTYEGLFDFFKKKKYQDSFSQEEVVEFKNDLTIDKVTQIMENKYNHFITGVQQPILNYIQGQVDFKFNRCSK